MYGYSRILIWLILSVLPIGSGLVVDVQFKLKPINDIALDHNLQQLVDEPTRWVNTLDLFFTKNESLVLHVNVNPV